MYDIGHVTIDIRRKRTYEIQHTTYYIGHATIDIREKSAYEIQHPTYDI